MRPFRLQHDSAAGNGDICRKERAGIGGAEMLLESAPAVDVALFFLGQFAETNIIDDLEVGDVLAGDGAGHSAHSFSVIIQFI